MIGRGGTRPEGGGGREEGKEERRGFDNQREGGWRVDICRGRRPGKYKNVTTQKYSMLAMMVTEQAPESVTVTTHLPHREPIGHCVSSVVLCRGSVIIHVHTHRTVKTQKCRFRFTTNIECIFCQSVQLLFSHT